MLMTGKVARHDLNVRLIEIHGDREGAASSTLAEGAVTDERGGGIASDPISDCAANTTTLMHNARFVHGA